MSKISGLLLLSLLASCASYSDCLRSRIDHELPEDFRVCIVDVASNMMVCSDQDNFNLNEADGMVCMSADHIEALLKKAKER